MRNRSLKNAEEYVIKKFKQYYSAMSGYNNIFEVDLFIIIPYCNE